MSKAKRTTKRSAAPQASGAEDPPDTGKPAPAVPTGRRLPGLSLLLVLLAALLPYLNGLGNGYLANDRELFVGSPHVQGASAPGYFFTADFWEQQNQGRSNRYQPLVMVSFAFNHRLGSLTPYGCHFTNLLLHLLVCLLLLLVLRHILPRRGLALAATLLYALHPLHTEAVAAVSGRVELLSALFLMAAWLMHLVAWTPGDEHDNGGKMDRRYRAVLVLSGTGLFMLALFSAGSALVLLPAVLLGDLLRYKPAPSMPAKKNDEDEFFTPDRRSLKHLFGAPFRSLSPLPWAGYGGLLAVLAGYLVVRIRVLGSFPGQAAIPLLDNPLAAAETPVRLMTAVKVLGEYLRLQFWPVHLSADYSFNQVKLVTSTTDPGFLASLAACLALLVGAAALWKMERGRAPAFGILFFFCAVAPVSNIPFPIDTIMAERLLYLPSLGFCLVLASLLALFTRELRGTTPAEEEHLKSRPSRRWMVIVLASLIALGYAGRTITRNRDWLDQQTLLLSAARVSPDSARVHGDLGIGYFEHGDYPLAARSLERALEILPDYPIVLYMLGRTRIELGELESAREALLRVAELRPEHPEILLALGAVDFRLGRLEDATNFFRQTLDIAPGNRWAMESLGICLSQRGLYQEAIEVFSSYLERHPDAASGHYSLASALALAGRQEEAEAAFRTALDIDPDHQGCLLGLADICRRTDREEEAAALRARALGTPP